MICVSLKQYLRACGPVNAGISDVAFFDPSDFNFTQTTTSGTKGAYSAIAARAGATGTLIFPVNFLPDEGEVTWKQSNPKGSSKYTHEIIFTIQENSQTMTNFLEALDAAGICCGLGMIIRYNNGKIFVAGEKYVNGSSIPKFILKQDGSDGTSGKLLDDLNGGNIHIKGDYSRPLYEYSGSWASLEAFMPGAVVTPTTFDSSLVFPTVGNVTSATSSGVTGTVTASDNDILFEFNAITTRTGTPASMTIHVGSVDEIVIDYPTDYSGQAFRYKDKAGVTHTGVFTNGTVTY